jgi:hypothetical protein
MIASQSPEDVPGPEILLLLLLRSLLLGALLLRSLLLGSHSGSPPHQVHSQRSLAATISAAACLRGPGGTNTRRPSVARGLVAELSTHRASDCTSRVVIDVSDCCNAQK